MVLIWLCSSLSIRPLQIYATWRRVNLEVNCLLQYIPYTQDNVHVVRSMAVRSTVAWSSCTEITCCLRMQFQASPLLAPGTGQAGIESNLVWKTGAAPLLPGALLLLEWCRSRDAALPSSADFTISSGGSWGSLKPCRS